MKQISLVVLLLLTSALLSVKNTATVFICDSEGAVAYHSRIKCRGLQHCKSDILEVKPEVAFKRNLRACKLCY